MKRNLKTLGLAFAAVLALSAVAAQAASAVEFHSEKENTIVTGTSPAEGGEQSLTVSGGPEVVCTHLHLEGTQAGSTSSTLTTGFTYSGSVTNTNATKCDSFLGHETAEVLSNGCHYVFHASGTVDLACPEGKNLEIKVSTCTISIGSQSGLGTVTYTNSGSGSSRVVNGSAVVENIAYTSNDAFTCTVSGVAKAGVSKYVGKTTVSGYEDNGGETGNYTEGNQVGIWRE